MNYVKRMVRLYPWIIALIIGGFLIVGAARAHDLWGDEAETALFARNILKYGIPRGWDGTNIMGINNAVVLDKNLINHTSPWAQYYMVAAAFRLFGQSSFTARIPSIILFLLSIPLVYYVTKKITGRSRPAFLASLITALSVQGILFGYQARYYELTNVCGLLFLWASILLLEGRLRHKLLFILSGIVFFYANYVAWSAFFIATFLACGVYQWLTHGKAALKHWVGDYVLLSVPIACAAIPWFLIMHPLGDRGVITIFPLTATISAFWTLSGQAWQSFNASGVLPIGIAVIVLFVIFRNVKKWRNLRPLVVFGGVPGLFVGLMSVYATIALVDTIFSSPRYTTAAIPLFCIFVACLLDEVIAWRRWVGGVLLLVYLTTNLLTFSPPGSLFASLLYEIVHPYQNPETLVADYLIAHAKKGQTAFINLDYDYEPVIFLLGDSHALAFVNRVDPFNDHLFPKNRRILPRYIYDFRDEPDWVILFSKRTPDGTLVTTMDYQPLWPEVDLAHDYVEYEIPIFFNNVSRPEIERRSFFPIRDTASVDQVYIYKKK